MTPYLYYLFIMITLTIILMGLEMKSIQVNQILMVYILLYNCRVAYLVSFVIHYVLLLAFKNIILKKKIHRFHQTVTGIYDSGKA